MYVHMYETWEAIHQGGKSVSDTFVWFPIALSWTYINFSEWASSSAKFKPRTSMSLRKACCCLLTACWTLPRMHREKMKRESDYVLICTVNVWSLLCHPPLTWYICYSDCINCVLGLCYCVHPFQQASEPSSLKPLSVHQPTIKTETEQIKRASQKPSAVLSSSNLRRAGSIKDLISKFSGPENTSAPQSLSSGSPKSAFPEALGSPKSKMSPATPGSAGQGKSPIPSISVTPAIKQNSQNGAESVQIGTKTTQITAKIDCPVGDSSEKTDSDAKRKTQSTDCGRESVADSGMGSVSKIKALTLLSTHDKTPLHLLCMKITVQHDSAVLKCITLHD